ncbi:MAG: 2-oxo acid dehydrogenase subunit E2, partial [Rhodanobacteraceae bacterium]
MADTKTFHLPDLGEGLPDATIVEWLVKEGDDIKLDAPLVSMETAKAVVEVPSPYTGKVTKQYGKAGDVIETGAALADFQPDPNAKQRAEAESTGHHHGPKKPAKGAGSPAPHDGAHVVASDEGGEIEQTGTVEVREDEGTVVGAMVAGNTVHVEQAANVGGVKAVPAVRALAKKMKVDLARVKATGAGGVVTLKDVKDAAASGSAALGATGAPMRAASVSAPMPAPAQQRSTLSQSGKPMRTTPPSVQATGQPEQLKGVRRNMARVMADAHAQVVPTTLVDDADLHQWLGKQDITARLIRAIVTACRTVPALNAWFDGKSLSRTLHPHVDIGIAVDTDDGLFVPALRN